MTSTDANPATANGGARQDFGSADQNKPAENNRPTAATQAHNHPLGRDAAPDDAWQSAGEAAARVVARLADMLADNQHDIIEAEAAE
jgi:hypothetical protein